MDRQVNGPSVCWMRARITFAVIGTLIGVSIFVCFSAVYRNWDAAAWGLVSGVFAAVTLGVHIQYLRDSWSTKPQYLRKLMLLGCVVQLAGVAGFVAYLSVAIVLHQAVTPDGYYLVVVWCFMTWKWGFLLFYFSRNYKRLYEDMHGVSADSVGQSYEKI